MTKSEEDKQLRLDNRRFILSWYPPLLEMYKTRVMIEFTQRDILLILKHVRNRNKYLTDKIEDFIRSIDDEEFTKTDFTKRVPKSPIIRKFR